MAPSLPTSASEQQILTPPPSSKSIGPSARTKRRPDGKRQSQRSLSLGAWVKNFLPSQRPERGGTIRNVGYWELIDTKREDGQGPQLRAASAHRSRRSQTGDSNLLTRWNTPKDLPTCEKSSTIFPLEQAASSRANRASSLSHRKWSWIPEDLRRETLSIPKFREPRETRSSGSDLKLETESASCASLTAERRLSQTRRSIEAKKEVRRLRKDLKESGDYLGVQGINPETSELDVISPSSSEISAANQEANGQIRTPTLRNTRAKDSRAVHQSEGNGLQAPSKNGKEKSPQSYFNPSVKWRRHTKQWSSAQEPRLSPVAQSLKSATPISDMAGALEPAVTEQLVDLNIPEEENPDEQEQNTPQTSGGTSKTSLTVVHTPHRLSHSAITPAAVELFENGIEFNGESPIGKEKVDHMPTTRTGESSDDSFLGGKSLGGTESQGNSSNATPTRSDKDMSHFKSLIVALDSQFVVPKNSFLQEDITTIPNAGKDGHELLKNSKGSDVIGEKAHERNIEQAFRVTDQGSPLQKLSPKAFVKNIKNRQRSKKKSLVNIKKGSAEHNLRLPVNQKEMMPVTGAYPEKGSEQLVETAASVMEFISTKVPVLAEEIERDASSLNSLVDKVDKNESESSVVDEARDREWSNWVKGVVKVIVESSEGIKDDLASTYITTTTGSGQKTSASSLKQEILMKGNSIVSNKSLNESTSTRIDVDGREFRVSHAQNTSLSIKLDQGTDIMSTAIAEQELSEMTRTKTPQGPGVQHVHSMSPMCMFVMDQQKTDLAVKEPDLGMDVIPAEKSITRHGEVAQSGEGIIQDSNAINRLKELLQPTEQLTVHVEDGLSKLTMSYPGSYPLHPDANDDIANLFGSLVRDTRNPTSLNIRISRKGVLSFYEECFRTVQSVLRVSFRLLLVPLIHNRDSQQNDENPGWTSFNTIVALLFGFPGACLAAWAFS